MARKTSWLSDESYTTVGYGGLLSWCHRCKTSHESHTDTGHTEITRTGTPIKIAGSGKTWTTPIDLYTCSLCGHEFCASCLYKHGCWVTQ